MFQVFVSVILAQVVIAQHARIIGEPGNGERIPIDLTVQGNTVIAVSGQPDPPQPNFKQSMILFDFEKFLEARKVIEDNVCYIQVLRANFGQAKKFVFSAQQSANRVSHQVSEEWNIPGEEIRAEDLERTVGTKIAEFCSGYRVFWRKTGRNMLVTHVFKRQVTANIKFEYSKDKGATASIGVSIKF